MEREKNNEMLIIQSLESKLLANLSKVGYERFHEWRRGCLEVIDKHYPDKLEQSKYKLYNLFIGSSWDARNPYFDFEGEASIQKMIDSLEV
jgi:hypothetical protein